VDEEEPIGDEVAHLRFEPKDEIDPNGFTAIDLWVNQSTLLPVQVKVVEQSGDVTTLRLTSLTLNPELDDTLFDPMASIPEGTEIIEPRTETP
jgi:outer membrane lipoprotein-sorting protein